MTHPLRTVARARVFALPAGALTGAAAAALVAGVGAANGGYFPTSWGWAGITLAWAALVALLVSSEASIAPAALWFVAALSAFVAWVALSAIWSASLPQTLLELEREVVYVAAALLLLLVPRRRVASLLGGSLVGVVAVCGYSLSTRLLPDRLGVFDPAAGYRLSTPLGYWNALGLFAAMAAVLALGLISFGSTGRARALAGAALVVLLPTLQFTFSRGGWIALGIGVGTILLLERRRLRLLAAAAAAAPAPALAVALGWRSQALTTGGADLAAAVHDGHRLAAELLGLVVLGGGLCLAFGYVAEHRQPGRRIRRATGAALVVAAACAAAVAVAAYGSPAAWATRAWDGFAAPPAVTGSDLNARLFSLSGSGRTTQWRVALEQYRDFPLLGSGAGTYERYWLQHRGRAIKVRDAHSLYLETLAELGPIGLALLLVALATPLVALRRARRHPLGAVLAGAYVAFLAHAAVDWDWEVPAVAILGLFCGAAILIAAGSGESRPISQRARLGGVAATVALIVVAFVGLVGNVELSRAGTAARAGDWAAAAMHARRAHAWAPWSSEPWQRLGEAQLARGDNAAARASFGRAIGKDPEDWNLWFDLARATTRRAQAAALRQATRLDPHGPEIARLKRELAAEGAITIGR